MAKMLDQPRYKCALAAMQTVHNIPGAIPILHSGPGCGGKLNDNEGTSGKFSPNIFPCTSVSEKEIVFGGTDRLRETIANALKIIDADLFVVLTGCTAEIIGDDIEAVVAEFAGGPKPVVHAKTPGFKGTNFQGHDWIMSALFKQYLPQKPQGNVQKGLVNIFAGPPVQDPFWLGNLRELERLISLLGLTPNTIFGHGRGLPNLNKVPLAEFNVLVSPWVGIESVKLLQEKYGTPFLHYPVLPIGAFETTKFLRAVGEFTGANKTLVEAIVTAQEEEYYYYIERYADVFLERRIMSKRFVTVADAQYSLAVTKFLVNDLGLIPSTQYITDNTPEEYRPAVIAEYQKLNYNIPAAVEFLTDGHEIHRKIQGTDFAGFPLILGSSWEKQLAQKVNGTYVNISYPVMERLIMNSGVAGYAGGLKLLEDIYSAALARLIL
jgi:nitrogenase molybdenum-iron protein beta chain